MVDRCNRQMTTPEERSDGREKPAIAADRQPVSKGALWFLEEQSGQRATSRHLPIHSTPFTIGRRTDLSLSLRFPTISTLHAEIVSKNNVLFIRDLRSTNGTYVNGKRISNLTILKSGDLIQFADLAFRIHAQVSSSGSRTLEEDVCDKALALVQFDQLMAQRAVTPFYQPIITMVQREVIGYESLARSRMYALESPDAMFRAAAQLNQEIELSRMLRWESIQATKQFAQPPHLFLNTHPRELEESGLIESMRALRESSPAQKITLEIHEAAVADADTMRELRAALTDLDISLAYDDFGAGQTRLIELVEVRPDYLKFDMQLIRDIHLGDARRQQMLESLVRMVRGLGVISLAEGVETEGESQACLQMQFDLGQGFYYGKPAPFSADPAPPQLDLPQ